MEKGLVSVDRWTEGSQAYFLTHLHSDHTQGLSSTWSRAPIFCSRITAKLFPFKFPDFNLSLLRVVDVGFWYSLSLVFPSSASRTTVEFMPIHAHHCPGAVMFLFRGDFGWMLYTGDFRWEANSERAQLGRTTLLNALKGHRLDVLHLDNTYCNPSYDFPPRSVAAQQVVDIIVSHPEHDIIIGIDTLGKEELLLRISRLLKTKIWVWPERLQTMHLLGFHHIFTTKTTLTRIRAVPRYSFSIDTLEELNKKCPTIGIMPSGVPWLMKPSDGADNLFGSLLTSHYKKRQGSTSGRLQNGKFKDNIKPVDGRHRYIYSVPYSDHSCYAELQEFIELVQPISMKGIVSSSCCYVDPVYYFGRLCGGSKPLERLSDKQEKEDGSERVVAPEMKSCLVSAKSTNTDRKRKTGKGGSTGIHALRRVRRGAKIIQNDFSADSLES
ncbi:hypothetical protein K2173_018829 [Erythroxylum novogranatense]|uniref:Protein artemis n=1 Tax=Erythroxylum novogranatense TaxID=1862640 RepID=A0AAV8SBC7_9ROSI|nr:hypothetical protein K2173_018829 [Erythroxylum novogranatense]